MFGANKSQKTTVSMTFLLAMLKDAGDVGLPDKQHSYAVRLLR